MRVINKIYNWFKKVILNILGFIMDMINKDNENKVEIMKIKCEMAKYVVEKTVDGVKYVFGSRKIRLSLGVALLISCINISDDRKELDKGATDDEN